MPNESSIELHTYISYISEVFAEGTDSVLLIVIPKLNPDLRVIEFEIFLLYQLESVEVKNKMI